MSKATRIEWTFHTSGAEGSGTDSTIKIKLFRDNQELSYINQEPGETARLDRGEVGTYYWTFKNPADTGTSASGHNVPYTEDFPLGVHGHLRVELDSFGDDAWRIGTIESKVVSGHKKGIAGTIDSWEWVEEAENFVFPGEDILSTDTAEGTRRLTLNY
jgi:hypothetical protein